MENKDPFVYAFSAKQTTSQNALHVQICGLSIPNSRVSLTEYQLLRAFVETIISGHPDVDFCPYNVKFIRRNTEGWEVVERDSQVRGLAGCTLERQSVQPLNFVQTGLTDQWTGLTGGQYISWGAGLTCQVNRSNRLYRTLTRCRSVGVISFTFLTLVPLL